jgi:hypothetical protein
VEGVSQNPIHFLIKVIKIKFKGLRQPLANGRLSGANHAAEVDIH